MMDEAPFSLAFWINLGSEGYRVIAHKQGSRQEGGFMLLQENGKLQAIVGGVDNLDHHSAGGAVFLPPASQLSWTHLAVVYEDPYQGIADRLRVWANGELVIEVISNLSDTSPLNNTTPLRFGGVNGSAPASTAVGLVDDLRIYDRALDEAEIIELAQGAVAASRPPTEEVR